MLSSDASLCQPQPDPGVGVEDLDHLQERVEGGHGVAGVELLETEVVEEDVAGVHAQDCQRTPREGCGWGRG